MSTRTRKQPYTVINAVSMGADITSAVTILQSESIGTYQIVWSGGGSPVGTCSVQGSLDYALNPDGTGANAGTWSTLFLNVNGSPSSTISISGNSGNGIVNISEFGAYAIRLIYTRASGTGTMTAKFSGKVA